MKDHKIVIPKVIAHRGASAYAPENTLASFNKAFALGAKCIEFDVVISQDGEPFIFHDTFLHRTTNGQGGIGNVNSAYLYSLDAGSWYSKQYRGQQIPHFGEMLQWLNTFNMQANIEIKPYSPQTAEQTTRTILNFLFRYWPTTKPWPLISSFDLNTLNICKQLAPCLPLGLLLHEWDSEWLKKAKSLDCYSIHYYKNELNSTRVKEIKLHNYQLLAYTVNYKHQANKLLSWGVDSVFSDYPNLLD